MPTREHIEALAAAMAARPLAYYRSGRMLMYAVALWLGGRQ